MVVHLVYPVDFSKRSAPWSLGNHLYKFLTKKKISVKIYQWTSCEKIKPKKNDILIGHAHPNPYSCFRISSNHPNWKKKILLQPFNSDKYQMSYLHNIINEVDLFLAISGEYWIDNIDKTIFKSWKNKMIRVDMGINRTHYPFIKKNFNPPGKRKFLYIGNDYEFNNYAKNLKYLNDIIENYGAEYFSIAGNKKVNKSNFYGWLNFSKKKALEIIQLHDFYIIVSTNDANPTTIIEAMSWGLIPIATHGCGYSKNTGIINVPQNNVDEVVKILHTLQHQSSYILEDIQKKNISQLEFRFNWKKICNEIYSNIFNKDKKLDLHYISSDLNDLKKYEKKSKNYYLRLKNILRFFLISVKYIIKKNIKI
jgi:glycosyltransferase involved in cell wall biosynthesis